MIALVVPGKGEDQALGPLHLEIPARNREAAFGVAPQQPPGAAGPGIEIAVDRRHALGAEPFGELPLVGPGVEQAFRRRVEAARQAKREIVNGGGHGLFPLMAWLLAASVRSASGRRRACRTAAPRSGDRTRSNPWLRENPRRATRSAATAPRCGVRSGRHRSAP